MRTILKAKIKTKIHEFKKIILILKSFDFMIHCVTGFTVIMLFCWILSLLKVINCPHLLFLGFFIWGFVVIIANRLMEKILSEK
ncbi:hypothetical protein CL633_00525 [bacterium]|nr:hypothetical protein [bacterium]